MSAGSAEPDRPSQDGTAPEPKRDKQARSLAETMAFRLDDVEKPTQTGTPQPDQGAATGASSSPHKTSVIPAELAGRFRIQKLLGRGGMASVYLANDKQLDRPVALKVPQLTS